MEVVRKICRIAASVVLMSSALGIRMYLRVLDYVHNRHITKPNSTRRILFLQRVLLFFQKACIYWVIFAVLCWKSNVLNPIYALCLVLIPRLVFAHFVIAEGHDLNRKRVAFGSNKDENISSHTAQLGYAIMKKFLSVLNCDETRILTVAERTEYILRQLLGYSYNHMSIWVYSELESFCALTYLLYGLEHSRIMFEAWLIIVIFMFSHYVVVLHT